MLIFDLKDREMSSTYSSHGFSDSSGNSNGGASTGTTAGTRATAGVGATAGIRATAGSTGGSGNLNESDGLGLGAVDSGGPSGGGVLSGVSDRGTSGVCGGGTSARLGLYQS